MTIRCSPLFPKNLYKRKDEFFSELMLCATLRLDESMICLLKSLGGIFYVQKTTFNRYLYEDIYPCTMKMSFGRPRCRICMGTYFTEKYDVHSYSSYHTFIPKKFLYNVFLIIARLFTDVFQMIYND